MSDKIEVLTDDELFQAPTVCAVVSLNAKSLVALFAYEATPQQVKDGWQMKAEVGEAGNVMADPDPEAWINKFSPEDGAYGICQLDFTTPVYGDVRGQRILEHEFTSRGFLLSDSGWEKFDDWIMKFFHKQPPN